MNLDELTLGQIKEIQALACGPTTAAGSTLAPEGATIIAVLDRGWVVVGKFSQRGTVVTLSSAFVIRRWGTTGGLGELVDGPASETKLDKVGTWVYDTRTSVGHILCDSKAWEKNVC